MRGTQDSDHTPGAITRKKDAWNIEPDITRASTLPSSFYRSKEVFDGSRTRLFARSWQLAETGEHVLHDEYAEPFTLLPGFLNEPLLLVNNAQGRLNCLSNVCTHRGNLLVQHPGKYRKLVCNYHGRRFTVDGTFDGMPEFEEAKDFPRPCDHLHKVPMHTWNQFPFVSLDPAFDFSKVEEVLNKYVGFLPVSQFRHAPEYSRDYLVNAHWALYCDNYLEGFHIPFVHPDLNKMLDYRSYETLLFDYCSLQIGVGSKGTDCFELPVSHVDHGRHISAYYFWIFPNMMFNFYPWGLSINVVKPLSESQCKVSFHTYVFDEKKFNASGGGGMLDKVEREDEFVVENIQRGMNSSFYSTGRFSPSREKGVHHFHQLISRFMSEA